MGQLRDVVPRRRINSQLRKGSVAPTELYALNSQLSTSPNPASRQRNSSIIFLPMPKKSKSPVAVEQIDGMIRTIRGVRVMLDRDLAKIYGVPTFRFNEAIKRNRHRFPSDFMFQLTRAEFDKLKEQSANSSQIAISKRGRGGRRTRPYAFTEQILFFALH